MNCEEKANRELLICIYLYLLGQRYIDNWHQLIEAEWRIYASVHWPSLDQIMACHLVGAKPLSEPMLEYC